MNKTIQSTYVVAPITALENSGVTAQIVGWGIPPIAPYEQDGFTLERILKSELECTTHDEVMRRIQIVEKHADVYCYLIAHEVKKKITPPRVEIPQWIVNTARKVLPVLGAILAGLATIVATVVTVLFNLVLMALMADPIVIAVIKEPDGQLVWLQIARWYE